MGILENFIKSLLFFMVLFVALFIIGWLGISYINFSYPYIGKEFAAISYTVLILAVIRTANISD